MAEIRLKKHRMYLARQHIYLMGFILCSSWLKSIVSQSCCSTNSWNRNEANQAKVRIGGQSELEYDRISQKFKVGEHGDRFNFWSNGGCNGNKNYVFFIKNRTSNLISYLQVNSKNELELSSWEYRPTSNNINLNRIFVAIKDYRFHHPKYILQHCRSQGYVTTVENDNTTHVVLTNKRRLATKVQF